MIRIGAYLLCFFWSAGAWAADPSGHFYRVSVAQAEQAVAEAIVHQGLGDKVKVTLLGSRKDPLYAANEEMSVEVKTLQVDAMQSRWSANLLFHGKDAVLSAMPASGRYELVKSVPVLNTRKSEGEVITPSDVVMIDLVDSRVHADTIQSREDLIGKTPKRVISPERPIRKGEVALPPVVNKGDTVEVFFHAQRLEIKAVGEALDAGATGDTIRVKNIDSNTILRAVIEGPKRVTVIGGRQ